MDAHDPLLSEAYRQAARAEPPAALDARILAAANQAVANQTAAKSRPHRTGWLRWVLPASTTAVLVLAVALVLRMQADAPGPLIADYAPAKTTAAPAPVVEATAPATASPPRAGAEPARASVAAAPAKADVAAERAASRGDQPAAPLPFPATAARMERAQADTAAAPPSLAAGEAAGIAGAPAAGAVSAAPSAAGNLEMRKTRQPLTTQAETEQDIERIRSLLREGRIDEARRAVAEFVRRYPAYALPADLHGLR